MYDVIIVGAGYAGSIMAHKFASENKKVLIIEKRAHIGGNMYDFIDENGVRYHKYGPHIFHTTFKQVVDFLSNFTDWYKYEHRVLGKINDKFVPVPFNLKSIDDLFEEDKAKLLKDKLISNYGLETKVPILELRKSSDDDLRELADFIFEKVFKYYTMKQWDLKVEEIDPSVTARVPVHISYDDRYFQDEYQMMPKEGYTKIFEKMLDNENIEIRLNTDSSELIYLDIENKKIYFNNELYTNKLIYTGPIDELFNYYLGELPYRSLEFVNETHNGFYQDSGTVNYPTPKEVDGFTRITEYKHLMDEKPEKTTIAIEYPYAYDRNSDVGNIPYYPVFTAEIKEKYKQYKELADSFDNLVLLGRLAEFKYYNMDLIIKAALDTFEKIK